MKTNTPLIINFAPTGMLPARSNSSAPLQPQEIIEQVHEAYETGITLVHLHARDNEDKPTQSAMVYDQILAGLRQHCPDLVLGLSLSGRMVMDPKLRAEPLQTLPDLGSLTLSSLNFPKAASINSPDTIMFLLEEMLANGVKPEFEAFDAGMIQYSKYLINKLSLSGPHYFNLLLGNLSNAPAELTHAGLMIRDIPDNSYWSFGGIGSEQLIVNSWAISTGGGVRIGLEDNLWWDTKKTKPATNIALLKRIHALAEIFERPIMPSRTFGELGYYNKKARA